MTLTRKELTDLFITLCENESQYGEHNRKALLVTAAHRQEEGTPFAQLLIINIQILYKIHVTPSNYNIIDINMQASSQSS